MAERKGLTLIEIIVVMVIVAIAVAFAISSFMASIEQTRAQMAKNNLLAIAAAQQKFYEDYSSYCISTGTNPTGISTYCGDTMNDLDANLHLSIFKNDPFTYSCTATPAPYQCTASDTVDTLTLTVTALGASVSCANGSNPSYCPS